MSAGLKVKAEDVLLLCNLPDAKSPQGKLYTHLRMRLLNMRKEPMIALLTLKDSPPLDELFILTQQSDNPESVEVRCRNVHCIECVCTCLHVLSFYHSQLPCCSEQ